MDRCLDEAPTCTKYKLTKAECLAFLGRYAESQEIANSILHLNKGNAEAIYVRGGYFIKKYIYRLKQFY